MEIKNLLTGLGQYDPAKVEKADADAQKARREKASAKGKSDQVSLSNEAKLRTEAHSAAQAAPEVRHDKVAEIKARIQSGEYEINTKKIAEKMVQEDLELLI